MAYLLVESLGKNKSRFVQRSGKILELLILTVGLVSIVLAMKDALLPYSSTCSHFLMGFWSFMLRFFFSSPPTIIIAVNLMVFLIFVSSTFYRPHREITFIPDVDDHLHHQNNNNNNNEFLPPTPAPVVPAPVPPTSRDVPEITPPPPPAAAARIVPEITPPAPAPAQPPSRIVRELAPSPLPSPMDMLERRGGRYINDAVSATPTSLPSPKPVLHETYKTRGPPPRVPHPLEKWKDAVTEITTDDEEYRPKNNENQDEDNTMEATWEAITGQGREKQKTTKKKKQVKRQSHRISETWKWEGADVDVPPPVRRLDSEEVVPSSPKWKELRKAETFNDAVSVTRRGGLIRKVPSMSMEDFNNKVEAFIHSIKHRTGTTLKPKPNRTFFDVINRKRH